MRANVVSRAEDSTVIVDIDNLRIEEIKSPRAPCTYYGKMFCRWRGRSWLIGSTASDVAVNINSFLALPLAFFVVSKKNNNSCFTRETLIIRFCAHGNPTFKRMSLLYL